MRRTVEQHSWTGRGPDSPLLQQRVAVSGQQLGRLAGRLSHPGDGVVVDEATARLRRTHTYTRAQAGQERCLDSSLRLRLASPTLSRAATKPASLLKADMTRALYFLCTSRVVCTYTLGSCKHKAAELLWEAGREQLTCALLQPSYIERRLSALLDGGQALVVDVGLQELLQLPQPVCDPRHQVVHAAQI